MTVGRSEKITLTAPTFATDPAARCKGIGVPLGYGGVYKGPQQSALIRFNISAPTDMTIEWRAAGEEAWNGVVNPEPLTEHFYLLPDLTDRRKYQVHLTCRSE